MSENKERVVPSATHRPEDGTELPERQMAIGVNLQGPAGIPGTFSPKNTLQLRQRHNCVFDEDIAFACNRHDRCDWGL